MAKITTFNTPPNWPAPPAGWTPPAGWQPDPAWGPPPPNWALWIQVRANPKGWIYSFGSAVAFYLVFLVIALVVTRGGLAAEVVGALFTPFFVAGLIVGFISRAVRSHWPVWLYLIVVFGVSLVLRMLSFIGRQNSGV